MYKVWGKELIEANTIEQMDDACKIAPFRAGAVMPDAHLGYFLPVGGVFGLENAVSPYAVGVDIACRMKLSVIDRPVGDLKDKHEDFCDSLKKGTLFGAGKEWNIPHEHEVMDNDWNITSVTQKNKDKAHKQLGTSGSGNHFVDIGTLDILVDSWPARDSFGFYKQLGRYEKYIAIMSHSGSRGTGHSVCMEYHGKAKAQHPEGGEGAWLDMNTVEGQEYWAAMNLMGEYASANHDVIHKSVIKLLGAEVLTYVENHHNFAWKEVHDGKELYVHRKGATPADKGVLGVIPGSMADYAYVVIGKGESKSLNSASHGAGRQLSRTQGKKKYSWGEVRGDLLDKGITVLGGGADEAPGVYKPIDEVMKHQQDLVYIVARFEPKIVIMCGDRSKAED
jgi:tRNA-splicing ligase RtcB (3'-phosphate/5'-hydroxy nucleic acid ligase)